MGMGEITSGGPCGRYQVRLIHNKQRLEDMRAILVDRRTQMELDAAKAQSLWDGAWQELQDARAELISLMETLPAENSSVKQARNRVLFAQAAVQRAESILLQAQARLTEASKRLGELELKEDPVIDAFAADYSRTLSGIVGTCEVNGEGTQKVVIRPGFTDDAKYNAGRDGLLFHRNSLSAEQAYFNHAIFPGWQKWMPTYRVGELKGFTYPHNWGIVYFQPMAQSSSQDLRIDQAAAIAAPFDYMDCDHRAFLLGDKVLVQFDGQDWDSPRIIGFANGPRPCMESGGLYQLDGSGSIWISPPGHIQFGAQQPSIRPFDPDTCSAIGAREYIELDRTPEMEFGWIQRNNWPPLFELGRFGDVSYEGYLINHRNEDKFCGFRFKTMTLEFRYTRTDWDEDGFILGHTHFGPMVFPASALVFWLNEQRYRIYAGVVSEDGTRARIGSPIVQRVSWMEEYYTCPQYTGPA